MSTPPDNFQGPMPILPTPVTPDERIDEASLRRLVRYCLACEAVAIGHFGIASEFFKLSEDDRKLIAEVVIDEVGGHVPVFLGATGASEALAVRYAEQAHSLGADMLMVAIPYVNVPDQRAMCDYYRRVADASPLPIILQDTPTSAPMLTAQIACELFEEVPTIQYIKAEGNDFLTKSAEVMARSGGRMPVIGGYGGKFMIHMLRIGVTSFMTGTEALDLHNAVIRTFLAGDHEGAAALYFEKLLPYFTFYEMHPERLLKQMLHDRGVIDHPDVIRPHAGPPLSEVEQRELKWVIQRAGLDKPPPGV